MTRLLLAAIALALLAGCTCNPAEERTWNHTIPDWGELPITVSEGGQTRTPIYTAIDLWNSRAGCELFAFSTEGNADVEFLSANGQPCGDINAQALGADTAAGAYLCGDRVEIHVSQPGSIWRQAFIAHHELGHALGLADDPSGAMGPVPSEAIFIAASDKDAAAVRGRWCR